MPSKMLYLVTSFRSSMKEKVSTMLQLLAAEICRYKKSGLNKIARSQNLNLTNLISIKKEFRKPSETLISVRKVDKMNILFNESKTGDFEGKNILN